MKTKLEIINETVEFYSQDVSRRALAPNGDCTYKYYNKRCAVGRYIKDENINKVRDSGNFADIMFKKFSFDVLKDEYKIEDEHFWRKLQNLHDSFMNWDSNGITRFGLEYADELRIEFAD